MEQSLYNKAKALECLIHNINKANELKSLLFHELLDLSGFITAQCFILDSGEKFNALNIKGRIKKDIHSIVDNCKKLELSPGIIAPINFVYLRHHYSKLLSLVDNFEPAFYAGISFSIEKENRDIEKKQAIAVVKKDIKKSAEPVYRSALAIEQRQSAVFSLFKDGAPLHLKDIKIHFPDYSERTLKGDLNFFVRTGAIIQEGFGRGSRYIKNMANNKAIE